MGFFDNLFGAKPINEEALKHLLTLTKVGLAFLSGSDGGSVRISSLKNEIKFNLQCRSVFFEYKDNLGISEEALLKRQGGQCPLDIWEYFKSYVNIYSKPAPNGDGHEVTMESSMEMAERNTSAYLTALTNTLNSIYPQISINQSGDTISVLVSRSNKQNYSYR